MPTVDLAVACVPWTLEGTWPADGFMTPIPRLGVRFLPYRHGHILALIIARASMMIFNCVRQPPEKATGYADRAEKQFPGDTVSSLGTWRAVLYLLLPPSFVVTLSIGRVMTSGSSPRREPGGFYNSGRGLREPKIDEDTSPLDLNMKVLHIPFNQELLSI